MLSRPRQSVPERLKEPTSKRVILVVDLQNDCSPSGKLPLVGIEAAADNAARVIATARASGDEIIHIRHEFTQPDAPFFAPSSQGGGDSSVGPTDRERADHCKEPRQFVSRD